MGSAWASNSSPPSNSKSLTTSISSNAVSDLSGAWFKRSGLGASFFLMPNWSLFLAIINERRSRLTPARLWGLALDGAGLQVSLQGATEPLLGSVSFCRLNSHPMHVCQLTAEPA
jgi:hypothetical protein